MKIILVPVADRPECTVALDVAFELAKKFSASVVGCHLRPHREEPGNGDDSRLLMAIEESGMQEVSKTTATLNSRKAHELFAAISEQHNIQLAKKRRSSDKPLAYWQEMVGTPDRVMGITGPVSDLLVVSRPKKKARGPARAFMLAALLNSGKPVLVLPQKKGSVGKRICIAWNQSIEAARAVSAAMPLLQQAESVHIVCSGPENAPGPKISHLKNYLAMWGVEASSDTTRGHKPRKELLEQYKKHRSDLLVMGAYSRSHLRERILGGMTHDMLNEPKVSLFAVHS